MQKTAEIYLSENSENLKGFKMRAGNIVDTHQCVSVRCNSFHSLFIPSLPCPLIYQGDIVQKSLLKYWQTKHFAFNEYARDKGTPTLTFLNYLILQKRSRDIAEKDFNYLKKFIIENGIR